MKIGIDVSQVVYPGGVGVYTRQLVENLLSIDGVNEYILFAGVLGQRSNLLEWLVQMRRQRRIIADWRSVIRPIPPRVIDIFWNRMHVLPIENLIGRVDVFHSSDWAEPPVKFAKKVTTVHDLAPFKYPKQHHPRIVAVHKRKMRWVLKESDVIIAVSESTRQDLVELFGAERQKIVVVYEGVSSVFFGTDFLGRSDKAISLVRKKYGLVNNYILTVGTRQPRKNLERVIRAYRELDLKKNIDLVIVGSYGWGKDVPQVEGVRVLGYVPQEDLPWLYRGAKCFVYVSLYEGFGLPILEAMAAGVPVMTSNLSSLPEIAGKAALLVNPTSTEQISRGIKRLLEDGQFVRHLKELGLKRARCFDWKKCAEQTLKIYGKMIT